MFCREDMSVTVWNHLGKRSVLYLFNIRRQEVALLALARSPANLSDQLVELLLAEDVIAFGVVVVGRDASHGRLVHHAAERARSLRHGRSPRADSASQGHALGNGRGLLGELLGDRHLGLDACLLRWVCVGVALLLHGAGIHRSSPGGRRADSRLLLLLALNRRAARSASGGSLVCERHGGRVTERSRRPGGRDWCRRLRRLNSRSSLRLRPGRLRLRLCLCLRLRLRSHRRRQGSVHGRRVRLLRLLCLRLTLLLLLLLGRLGSIWGRGPGLALRLRWRGSSVGWRGSVCGIHLLLILRCLERGIRGRPSGSLVRRLGPVWGCTCRRSLGGDPLLSGRNRGSSRSTALASLGIGLESLLRFPEAVHPLECIRIELGLLLLALLQLPDLLLLQRVVRGGSVLDMLLDLAHFGFTALHGPQRSSVSLLHFLCPLGYVCRRLPFQAWRRSDV